MNEDRTRRGDPYRVNPDEHRGHDSGILSRLFLLLDSRRDDDPSGPRRIHPGGDRGREL